MLQKLQKRNSEGFTIIEVLIVLAIAGLIMVVVFLAVPALQRSGRNNALSTDANNILSAVGTYVTNNGGTLPTTVNGFSSGASSASLSGGTGTNAADVKLGGNITSLSINASSEPTSSSDVGTADIVTGTSAVCNSTGTGLAGGTPGSPRSYAILYVAESGNSTHTLKCVGS